MFDRFSECYLPARRGAVFARVGGSGPPVLLLHGYSQAHLMWHAVAALLASRFTVVAADLPRYGASFRPATAPDHVAHSKRALAVLDMVPTMTPTSAGTRSSAPSSPKTSLSRPRTS